MGEPNFSSSTAEMDETESDKKDEKDEEDDFECAICSTDIVEEFSRPEPCYHRFHYMCIKTWSGIKLTCPMCRMSFKRIFTYTLEDKAHPKLKSTEVFEQPKDDVLEMEEYFAMNPYDHTVCKICGGGDNEAQILLCDDCDEGYHMYCLNPPLTEIPIRTWFCPDCTGASRSRRSARAATNHILATRTAASSRIANFVQQRLGLVTALFGSESSEEEDSDDYSDLDRAVLDAITPGPSTGARVERKRRSTKKKGKPKLKKRRRTRRKARRPRSKKLAQNGKDDAPLSPSKEVQESSKKAPAPRPLSITGGELDNFPYFEDETPTVPSPPSTLPEATDKFDLLGTIIPEQEKLLADGKLFKIENGKFAPTKEFEKYQEKLHKKFDKETKKRLGMPIEEDESKPAWDRPTSSKQKSEDPPLEEIEIDPEVQEQIDMLALQDKEAADQQLLDAQKKALADQKREKMEKKLAEDREAQLEEQERKKLYHDAEESLRHQEKVRKERERRDKKDLEKKEREERKKKEKVKEREAVKMKEEQQRKVEEERKKKDKRRSRSRSPRNKDKKDDRHKREEKKRDDRHKEERERKDKKDRRERDRKETNKPTIQAPVAAVGNSNNGVLGVLPPQAPPDYGSIYGNPFHVGNLSLLTLQDQQALYLQAAAQQQLAAFAGVPLPMNLPLATAAGFPLPNQLTSLQPIAPAPSEDRKEKEESSDNHNKGHKDQATKIIESYSIRTVKEYYTDKKINRQQYSDILKTLVGEYRRSKSVEQLKTKEMKKEIQKRTTELLRKAMKKAS